MLLLSSIYLKEFNRFKVSNIKEFKLNIDNKIQCIIGTNGCGKSSILDQLKPIVPGKSSFGKKGRKMLKLIHNDDTYELTSDFSHSGKAHSFKKNDEELNIGKGANIQQELIESHLNITPTILKILSCDLNICEMTPAKRKQILLALNPVNIDIFVDYHSKIRKELTKVRNNISMLHGRKEKLKEQMINKKELAELIEQRKYLKQNKIKTTQWIIKIQTILEDKTSNVSDVNFDEVYVKSLLTSFVKFNRQNIDIETDPNPIDIKLAQTNEMINNENLNIDKLISEIEEYKNHLKHTTQIEKIEIIDTKLKQTSNELDALKEVENDTGLNIEILKNLYENKNQTIQRFIDWVNDFRDLKHSVILSSSKLNTFKIKSEKLKNNISLISKEIASLTEKKFELEEKISSYLDIQVPKDCKKNICSLFNQYDSEYKKTKDTHMKIEKEISLKEIRRTKLEKISIRYNNSIQNQDIVRDKLYEMRMIFEKHFHLRQLLTEKISLKAILKTEPLLMIKELKDIFSNIEKIIKKTKLQRIQDELLNESKSLKSSTKISSDFINNKLKQDQIEYHKKKESLKYLINIKNDLEKKRSLSLEYKSILDNLTNEKESLKDKLEIMIRKKEKEFLEFFLNDITSYFDDCLNKETKIKSTIKSQEFIVERLKNEVIIPLRNLNKEKYILTLMEKGLRNISLEYTKDFLGKLIELSNFFLSKLATYPFVINKLQGDLKDFSFPVTINDIDISDISEASSGQKDMLRISFNLALMVILDKLMYPLFIDEIDKALDEIHKNRLIELFTYLLSENIISQIFLSNHHIIFQEGFDGDVVVLNSDNIAVPKRYNENVIMTK